MQKFDLPMVGSVLLGALLACASTALAQDLDGLTALDGPVEHYLDAARISGTIVAGVQTFSAIAAQRPSLSIAVPQGWDRLCLRLSSLDGLYTAEQEFTVTKGWPGGWDTIEFETIYRDELLGYQESEMAVLVHRGDCRSASGTFALAGWNQTPGSDGTLVLMINSFRADEVYVIDRDSAGDFDCTPVQGPSRTAFDTICRLPLDAFAPEGPLRLEINRIRNGNFDAPEIVEIARAQE